MWTCQPAPRLGSKSSPSCLCRRASKSLGKIDTLAVEGSALQGNRTPLIQSQIIGEWKEISGDEKVIEFFEDGRVTTSGPKGRFSGSFSLPDSHHIKLELSGVVDKVEPAIHALVNVSKPLEPPLIGTYSLSSERLVIRMSDEESTYQRVATSQSNAGVVDRMSKRAQIAFVEVGYVPMAVAVNPVTNRIYVCNRDSRNVTVIDGATNETATLEAGWGPSAVVVNQTSNMIYVANHLAGTVTVIDGATNKTVNVKVGTSPVALDVNPVTNKIYVANAGSNDLTVIDGATNRVTMVDTGDSPRAVAVNAVSNMIYVANWGSDRVTVIDGATNAAGTVRAGTLPLEVAVNPVTNKIYVANFYRNVTVIDGATNETTTVATCGLQMPCGQKGSGPRTLAVNPATNRIYVVNEESANVMVIEGATNATSTVGTGGKLGLLAVNPVTNKVFVTSYTSSDSQ
jgi:YVTN family beta-propeller protein